MGSPFAAFLKRSGSASFLRCSGFVSAIRASLSLQDGLLKIILFQQPVREDGAQYSLASGSRQRFISIFNSKGGFLFFLAGRPIFVYGFFKISLVPSDILFEKFDHEIDDALAFAFTANRAKTAKHRENGIRHAFYQ
jgi:hypothetical protein